MQYPNFWGYLESQIPAYDRPLSGSDNLCARVDSWLPLTSQFQGYHFVESIKKTVHSGFVCKFARKGSATWDVRDCAYEVLNPGKLCDLCKPACVEVPAALENFCTLCDLKYVVNLFIREVSTKNAFF